MVMGNLMSGLIQGMQARNQANESKEQRDLQKQLIKLQMANAKIKEQEAAQRSNFLNFYLERLRQGQAGAEPPAEGATTPGGAAQATPFADSFGPQAGPLGGQVAPEFSRPEGGLLDMLSGQVPVPEAAPVSGGGIAQTAPGPSAAGGQGGGLLDQITGMDPAILAAVGGMVDVDLLGAARLGETRRSNTLRESEFVTEEFKDPTGATVRTYRPKYGRPPGLGGAPAPGGGQGGMAEPPGAAMDVGQIVKPPDIEPFEFEVEGEKFSVLRNAQTGQHVTTPIKISAPKGESSETAGRLALVFSAIDNVKELRKMVIRPDGSINRDILAQKMAPLGGVGAGRNFNSLFFQAVDSPVRASTGAAIPKSEIPWYNAAYRPSILDNDALVKNKLDRLEKWANSYVSIVDPVGNITKRVRANQQKSEGISDAMPAESLPKEALDKLQEGMATRFPKNGQVWTLINGKPKRLDQPK